MRVASPPAGTGFVQSFAATPHRVQGLVASAPGAAFGPEQPRSGSNRCEVAKTPKGLNPRRSQRYRPPVPVNLPELIDMALALSRADRQGLLERLRESLEAPDVPGGIIVAPEDLVEEGAQYVYPRTRRFEREVVTLTAKVGPTLAMRLGAVAIADPWDPDSAPSYAVGSVAAKPCPTTVTVITRTRRDTGALEEQSIAATVGSVDEVSAWHPLAVDGQFHLDSDSGLGAFYEIYDAAALQPFFEDSDFMFGVFKQALVEGIVPLVVDGKTLASVFRCGKDVHPVWAGYDEDGVMVAAVIDFGLLAAAQGRAEHVAL